MIDPPGSPISAPSSGTADPKVMPDLSRALAEDGLTVPGALPRWSALTLPERHSGPSQALDQPIAGFLLRSQVLHYSGILEQQGMTLVGPRKRNGTRAFLHLISEATA